ncbi:MAG TPA: DUF4038 domain-containing protein [Tepidisphaeraceae bacterium]|jgi:hypothetical protein
MPYLPKLDLIALLVCLLSQPLIATEVNRVCQHSFTSTKSYSDPFNDIELDAIVTAPDGSQQRVPAYWAGGSTWNIRYTSAIVGNHTFKTICSDINNSELHNRTGSIEIAPYAGNNPFYLHGFIRVATDERHFEHTDGTPFLWLADTWWMGLTKRLEWSGFQTLTHDRVSKGFNVVQIVAGLYPDMPAFDERGANEAGFPWTKDYGRINPEYFDAADRRIAYLADHGIASCIVGGWGYHLPWTGVEKFKKHWRYLVARYSAYPTFWCIAGEGAMPYYLSPKKQEETEFQRRGLTEVARYVRSIDPQHHPITVHPTDLSRTQVTDPSVLDFEMLQTGHGDRASIPPTLSLVKQSRSAAPAMPTINSEVCYEGILGSCHEDVVRFMIWSCLLSETAGHTYGANGIWQVNERDKPYGKSPHGGTYGATPWDEAMKLPGSAQAGIAKKFLEQLEWYKFKAHPEWARYASATERPTWGKWIWYPEGDPKTDAPVAKRYFQKRFDVPAKIRSASLWLSVDDHFKASINGEAVGERQGWETPQPLDVTRAMKQGPNTLNVEAENRAAPVPANPAGLIGALRITTESGNVIEVVSDSTWTVSQSPGGEEVNAKELGVYGCAPWNTFNTQPSYGPFAAGAEKVRVVYVPEPQAVELHDLEPTRTYRVQVLDPASGKTRDLQDVQRTATLNKPRFESAAKDWVIVLTQK